MTLQKLILLVALTLFCHRVAAEVPVRDRSVDTIILRDGTRLHGTVKQPVSDHSVFLLMRGRWLREHHADLLNELLASGTKPGDARADAIETLNLHLKTVALDREKALERAGFLREQIERLQFGKKSDPDLVLLTIPAAQIRRRFVQPSDRRPVAFAAILNDVDNAESLSDQQLRQQMMTLPQENLLRELPGADSQSISVADRILINADRLFGNVTRLIRHGDHYLSEKNGSNSVTAITAQLLSDGLQQQLQQLLSEPQHNSDQQASKTSPNGSVLHPAAAQIADREKADLVQMISMQIDVIKSTAAVTIEVYRRRDDGVWHQILQVSANATSQEITAEQQTQIENDPQVKQVTKLFKSLGAANDISQAVAVGAVVQIAQRRAQEALNRRLSTDTQTPRMLEFTLPEEIK